MSNKTPHKNKPHLSIIIPALNESKYITNTLKTTHKYLLDNDFLDSTEVIVVAAKDKDNTGELAKKQAKNFKYFKVLEPAKKPQEGKGKAVQLGILAASGKYRLFMDADLATPLKYIKSSLSLLENGSDIVYAVRDINKMHKNISRKISSTSSNLLIRLVLLPGVKDSQCGFKAINSQTALFIYQKQTIMRWGFDLEILHIAKKHSLKISALPVPDWKDPKTIAEGLAGESFLKAIFESFMELFKIRLNSWRGLYK